MENRQKNLLIKQLGIKKGTFSIFYLNEISTIILIGAVHVCVIKKPNIKGVNLVQTLILPWNTNLHITIM